MILHIPHASTIIPDDLGTSLLLTEEELREELRVMTDWYTDELFTLGSVPGERIIYPVSRLVCDPERFREDAQESMAAKGMGAVYTKTSHGQNLRSSLDTAEREAILGNHYDPHHALLTEAVRRELQREGRCLIIDCHSFYPKPLPYMAEETKPRPEICLGTDGVHTPKWLEKAAKGAFRARGFTVEVNWPYDGALVPLEFYGKELRVWSIMIEVNQTLYLKEGVVEPNERFKARQQDLEEVLAVLALNAATHAASKITICWCPLVKESNYNSSVEELKRWADEIRGAAPLEMKTAALKQLLLQKDGDQTLQTAAMEFVSDSRPADNIGQLIGSILAHAEEQCWFGDPPNSGCLSVVFPSKTLLREGAKYKEVSEFLLKGHSPLGVERHVDISLGLYEEATESDQLKMELPWYPELNVSITYDCSELVGLFAKEGNPAMEDYLSWCCQALYQKSIMLRLHYADGNFQEIWFYNDTRRYASRQDTTIWLLERPHATQWYAQFSDLLENIKQAESIEKQRKKIRAEMSRVGFLGGTFHTESGHTNTLVITVSGSARFLFEASFPYFLPPEETAGIAPELLLLNKGDQTPTMKHVLYATYDRLDDAQPRCLCGQAYPTPTDSSHDCCLQEVVNLRTLIHGQERLRDWVKTVVANQQRMEWAWRLLSSPHFYYCDDFNKLKSQREHESDYQEEYNKGKARAEQVWECLLDGFFCGLRRPADLHGQPTGDAP